MGHESHNKYLSGASIYTMQRAERGILSWYEAALEVWISAKRSDDGVNYHLNSHRLLWWDHSCMILKVVPLSPTLIHLTCTGTQTCTHLIELLHNTEHWLGRKTEAVPPIQKPYCPNPCWTLLNRLQVRNWLRLLVTNSTCEFVFGMICTRTRDVWFWMQPKHREPQSFYHRQ